jgi:hypothetical protein
MFYAELRLRLNPILRSHGFKGSGRNFLRVRGEAINALNIQASRHSPAAAVNLGLHFAFLPPLWEDAPKPAEGYKEIECDLRSRLTPRSGHDHWWEYGSSQSEAASAAESVARTFIQCGEPLFQRFDTAALVVEELSVEALASRGLEGFPWRSTKPRLALTLARLSQHLGQRQQSAAYASYGLENLGLATRLRSPLEQLAHAT